MKLWYPYKYDSEEYSSIELYILKCSTSITLLRSCLLQSVNKTRIASMQGRIDNCSAIHYTDNTKFSLQSILNLYISSLQCKYDSSSLTCYFAISDIIKCPHTMDSLNYIIRLVEYGNDEIPPLHWLNDGYNRYKDNI